MALTPERDVCGHSTRLRWGKWMRRYSSGIRKIRQQSRELWCIQVCDSYMILRDTCAKNFLKKWSHVELQMCKLNLLCDSKYCNTLFIMLSFSEILEMLEKGQEAYIKLPAGSNGNKQLSSNRQGGLLLSAQRQRNGLAPITSSPPHHLQHCQPTLQHSPPNAR